MKTNLPAEATCYVCRKVRPISELQDCGLDVYRCKKHRSSTILRAVKPLKLSEDEQARIKDNIEGMKQDMKRKRRVWVITIPEIKITVETIYEADNDRP